MINTLSTSDEINESKDFRLAYNAGMGDFNDVSIFWYHKQLIRFLEKAVFAPDEITFDLYCQMNPGYQFKILTPFQKSELIGLHKKPLENFWKFNVMSRAAEIIQFYTDRTFAVSRSILGTPYVTFGSVKLRNKIKVPKTLYDKIKIFVRSIKTNRNIIHDHHTGVQKGSNYHAECFDNLVKDMETICNIIADSNIAADQSGSFVTLQTEEYTTIVKWLAERLTDTCSEYTRDTDLFFLMLRVFMTMHFLPVLSGKDPAKQSWDYNKTGTYERAHEVNIMNDPTHYFQNPEIQGESYPYNHYIFCDRYFKSIAEEMMYYGHLTHAQCLCTRAGILPHRGTNRVPDMEIVNFLAMQEYFYGIER